MRNPCQRILFEAIRKLEERLPPGWTIELITERASDEARLRFTSNEGRTRSAPVFVARRLDPRAADRTPLEPSLVVVAPYLSRSTREVLKGRGINYIDQTGHARVVLDEPGLFVLTPGADSNPWPDKRDLSLRGVKAGRVVRVLAARRPPVGVRELAGLVDADPGYVSRLLKMLDREALVERTPQGQVRETDWRRLLIRWSEDAPLEVRAQMTTWLAPRGLGGVLERLSSVDFRHLLTGSAAAARLAPVAPTRLLSIYVEDPDRAAEALDLRRADAGANVVLLQPEDDTLYGRPDGHGGARVTNLPTIAADLLTGPGRSPAQAEALMDWMVKNEGAWRG